MSTATIDPSVSTRSAPRHARSPFATLVVKDLRLAGPLILVASSLLVAISALLVAMPLFGESALKTAGLTAWKHDTLARVGAYSAAFWMLAMFAGGASAIMIAAGDAGGRTRYLVPTLPATPRLAYLSKCLATLITVSGFLLVGAVVWAFAAPMFARTSGGAFVAATVMPGLVFISCATCASVFAPLATRRMLIARGGADWLDQLRGVGYSRGSWIGNEMAVLIAAAVVILLGLILAWRARGVVLCRQTPRELRIPQLVRLAGIAASAAAVSTIAAFAWIWSTEPSISQIMEKAKRYSEWSGLPTSELVGRVIDAVDVPLDVKAIPKERLEDWERSLLDARWDRIDREQLSGVDEVLRQRCINDIGAVRAAAGAILESRPELSVPARLLAARYLDPRAELAIALQDLARTSRDLERLQLIDAVIRNQRVLQLHAGPRVEEEWVLSDGQSASAWNIPPFQVEQFVSKQTRDRARRRVGAAIALVAIEQALRTGVLGEADSRGPDDRFAIDIEMVRKAREAIEPPMTELAGALGISERNDSEYLLWRTTYLFHGPNTDPAYLLPRRD
jgi:hypothetical protein